MKLYRVFTRSVLPAIFGNLFSHGPFQAWTFGPFIFLPGVVVESRVIVHEVRHVSQFYVGWALGVTPFLIFPLSLWWLLATPLTYSLAYVLAGFYAMARGRQFYHGNPFERDARRHAGEPIE